MSSRSVTYTEAMNTSNKKIISHTTNTFLNSTQSIILNKSIIKI